jgi:competence protein ComEA
MIKKLLLTLITFISCMSFAHALEVNTLNGASVVTKDSLKGIAPITGADADEILVELAKGNFKNWSNFENRMKIKKSEIATQMSTNGLTIDGKVRPK